MRHALIYGVLAGIIFGITDIIARIVALKFEWFEFYQTIIINVGLFLVIFLLLALFARFLKKEKRHHFLCSAFIVIIIAGHLSLFWLFLFFSPLNKVAVIGLITIFAASVAFLIFLQGKNLPKKLLNPGVSNVFWFVALFVFFCFIADIYYISQPSKEFEATIPPGENLNIIFIVLDTVRADHLSLFGYEKNTSPNIDKFASHSIVFNNAVSVSSWTLPSHASMFTGNYPFRHNATTFHQKLDERHQTLAEVLSSNGYNSAGFIGAEIVKGKFGFSQGFMTYEDRLDFFEYYSTYDRFSVWQYVGSVMPVFYKLIGSDGERNSGQINQEVFRWLDKNYEHPFFLFINYFDAHDPYVLGREYRSKFTSESHPYFQVWLSMLLKERYPGFSPLMVEYIESLYDSEIFYMDSNFGQLMGKLQQLGILNQSIIVVVSDHGEEFYERGDFTHSKTLYEESIHVPLIIYHPDYAPQLLDARVGTINIFPTLLDFAGVAYEPFSDSQSLVTLVNGENYTKEHELSELYFFDPDKFVKAVSKDDLKLIIKTGQPTELYNLKDDPGESENSYDVLAQDPLIVSLNTAVN